MGTTQTKKRAYETKKLVAAGTRPSDAVSTNNGKFCLYRMGKQKTVMMKNNRSSIPSVGCQNSVNRKNADMNSETRRTLKTLGLLAK